MGCIAKYKVLILETVLAELFSHIESVTAAKMQKKDHFRRIILSLRIFFFL